MDALSKVISANGNLCSRSLDGYKRRLLMASKENDVFYLKLQWISCKDEAERKKLTEKILQALCEKKV